MNCNKSLRGPPPFFPILFIKKGRGDIKRGSTESKPLLKDVEIFVRALLKISSLKWLGIFHSQEGYFPEPEN
jgi:hypothetical protein